ncbi:small acid-soluble spore protein alpha/beta type [Tumebacillus sp. BK434]|uniref:small, acid-soluble spore protein, alpha/beta type n=1 Tax=Tumebacillus sp. BK434 TaxID=2512169 RepID=UPI001053AE12|nr:small, acid-soluble spore protein, alpha/beta type [Tumebacillus sp. BK434]TCP52468.1 small acid-soluble spore protein alpha/beta type [Tumebacillus sp. BK434]
MSKKKTACVLGSQQAMQVFKYEIAREIGLGTSHYEKVPRRLKDEVITDAISKRMIELADTQIRK